MACIHVFEPTSDSQKEPTEPQYKQLSDGNDAKDDKIFQKRSIDNKIKAFEPIVEACST